MEKQKQYCFSNFKGKCVCSLCNSSVAVSPARLGKFVEFFGILEMGGW